MKRWGELNPVRFDKKELKTDLGKGNTIFVGSSCDMFSENVSDFWISNTIEHCKKFDNEYIFQTKNAKRMCQVNKFFPNKSRFIVTVESDIDYPEHYNNSPKVKDRMFWFESMSQSHNSMISVEPIMDFNLDIFSTMLIHSGAVQVNIGADSGGNNLPEPSKEKLLELVKILQDVDVTVFLKDNLKRLLR